MVLTTGLRDHHRDTFNAAKADLSRLIDTFDKVNTMMSSSGWLRWQDSSGKVIACTEKIKVLNESLNELHQMAQDALEEAILMGVANGNCVMRFLTIM